MEEDDKNTNTKRSLEQSQQTDQINIDPLKPEAKRQRTDRYFNSRGDRGGNNRGGNNNRGGRGGNNRGNNRGGRGENRNNNNKRSRDENSDSVDATTLETGDEPNKNVTEESVGITEYLNKDQIPWTGLFKYKYSDFIVNEIEPNGKILYLTDVTSLPTPETPPPSSPQLTFELDRNTTSTSTPTPTPTPVPTSTPTPDPTPTPESKSNSEPKSKEDKRDNF